MPHYYIDTDDGIRLVPDDEGHDLPDAEAARRLALAALHELADPRNDKRDRRLMQVRVRDASGTVLYAAELALAGEWLTPRPG